MRWDWGKGLHGSHKEAYTHPENISGMAYHNTTAVVENFIGEFSTWQRSQRHHCFVGGSGHRALHAHQEDDRRGYSLSLCS